MLEILREDRLSSFHGVEINVLMFDVPDYSSDLYEYSLIIKIRDIVLQEIEASKTTAMVRLCLGLSIS